VALHFVEGVRRKASNRLVGISRKVYSRLSDIEDSSRSRASNEKRRTNDPDYSQLSDS
jgi:hypothetical protein